MRNVLFAVPALLLAGGVAAQNAADPKAKVPPPQYRSAFEGYRPFADEKPLDWRKSNEEVAKAAARKPAGHGGHHK